MEFRGFRHGSESQDSDEPVPPGTTGFEDIKKLDSPSTSAAYPLVSSKGVENAKKRLRAFSIQKKAPLTPVPAVKPVTTGNTTVLIGKLSSVRVTPKVEKPEDEAKKIPKPPKPGASKHMLESYSEVQKKTLADIEDMKRKMELVELGIPLGLICPSVNALPVKAMPTKAMPPIKTFLDTAKIDEIIREARKAKAEGREFKFDYQKFVPDYDNPFQRKKDVQEQEKDQEKKEDEPRKSKGDRPWEKSRWSGDRFDRRHDFRKDDRDKYKDKSRERDKRGGDTSKERDSKNKDRDVKSRDRDDKHRKDDKREGKEKDHRKDDKRIEREGEYRKENSSRKEREDRKDKEEKKDAVKKKGENTETPQEKDIKETDVDLNDYLVCDSWSLDADDKNASPKEDDKLKKTPLDPLDQLRQSLGKGKKVDSPKPKLDKLQPVVDSFKFEIDPNDDEILDIFDEDSHIEKYASTKKKSKKDTLYDSPEQMKFDTSNDGMADDVFLESVINEIKQENMSDDEGKGLVEYDESPSKDSKEPSVGSVTPELDDSMRSQSQKSDYSEGYISEGRKSTESGYKSTESGYKSTESEYKSSKKSKDLRLAVDKDVEEDMDTSMSRDVMDSLETWSFVLKICQPLLFRHDKNKCYKETRTLPQVWFTANPKLCSCVKDRRVVYGELETCKMALVDRVYSCDQSKSKRKKKHRNKKSRSKTKRLQRKTTRIHDTPRMQARTWYPRVEKSLMETPPDISVTMPNEWEDEGHTDPPDKSGATPKQEEEVLDREYQKFMEAVSWPETEDKPDSRSTTPIQQESKKKKAESTEEKKKAKKIKLSNDNWSQESEVEEEVEKIKVPKAEKVKEKRKRKHSTSSSDSEDEGKKKKKSAKKKDAKKFKSKAAKRRRLEKKVLKKLKEKKKKKKAEKMEDSDFEQEEPEKEEKKKEKKAKKKKQKLKKKAEKKKKLAKSSSSSDSSSSSESSFDSESESDKKVKKKKKDKEAKKKKEKKKKRRQSTSDSCASDSLFDVNVLNNIKTERDLSPRPREIISVKELHDDFSHTVIVKQEAEEESKRARAEKVDPVAATVIETSREESLSGDRTEMETSREEPETELNRFDLGDNSLSDEKMNQADEVQFKAPPPPTPPRADDGSQGSSQASQDSVASVKPYEKDESHLRPSSQNSNYSFNDVMATQSMYKMEDSEYESYDMYEQMAMAYQSDVASQQISPEAEGGSRRIETVVRARVGEIKCDWRPGAAPAPPGAPRPSRWGLKPGEVNIVLTGGAEAEPAPVYRIQSLANRTDNSIDYDSAYQDTYGAMDRLQYGDCFAEPARGTLMDRIHRVLQGSALGEAAKEENEEKETPEKGILVTKSLSEARGAKRVSFADGYKPGQDSDVEEPPVKKRKKPRRMGCAWPCPAGHADHVPLWDALPPPPPPPGSPPPPPRAAPPPPHLLRAARHPEQRLLPPPMHHHKFDPTATIPNFMPPEPPPGLINFP